MIDARWANEPNVAPYVWEASVNGVLCWVEYPETAPQVAFADIGLSLRKRDGVTKGDVHTFVNDTPATIRFRARPLRPANFPNVEIDIAPGDALVWTHRGVLFGRLGGGSAGGRYEAMLFGREASSGALTLMQMFPDGTFLTFDDYRVAMSRPIQGG